MTAHAPGAGRVVMVSTPIGNLGDLSDRARDALDAADVVCCEDTRRTRVLLSATGIGARGRLRSLHAQNEHARLPEILAELAAGRTVAVVTDAGTPGVSDPGSRLVAAAAAAGAEVTAVPGPSAVLAALVVSGLRTDRFCAEGFLPRKGAERRRRLAAIVADERTSVVFESPRRLAGTLAELAALAPDRKAAVCRELTKRHEEVWRGELAGAAEAFAEREVRGEVVIVLAGSAAAAGDLAGAGADVPAGAPRGADAAAEAALGAFVAARLAEGRSTREAAADAATALGVPRRRAYEAVLAARRPEPGR